LQARTIQLEQREPAATAASGQATPAQAATLDEAYGARLRGYVAFRLREPVDVDDVIREVFRRAVAASLPLDEAAPAWLFRVAHNLVVDHYRRRRFPNLMALVVDRADEAPGLPEAANPDEQLRSIDVAMRRLPGRQRAGIYLRYYEGMEFAQVALVLGMPTATAGSLVHRGLRRVAAALGPDGGVFAKQADLDLLELAEAVVAGRRTLSNVIDQIAVATPEDRSRRDSVAELQQLVVGLSAVRTHSGATAAFAIRDRPGGGAGPGGGA
jgi:RNA polymerase sigma factor (sigma-70 family)